MTSGRRTHEMFRSNEDTVLTADCGQVISRVTLFVDTLHKYTQNTTIGASVTFVNLNENFQQ